MNIDRRLLYCVHPNGGLVFASSRRAEASSRLNHALREAKTWGDFRQRVGEDEYEYAMELIEADDQELPTIDEPFSADQIPGFSDGWYPPWVQEDMQSEIPLEVLQQFGTWTATPNGAYWHIEPDLLSVIRPRLERLGFQIEESRDLIFY